MGKYFLGSKPLCGCKGCPYQQRLGPREKQGILELGEGPEHLPSSPAPGKPDGLDWSLPR